MASVVDMPDVDHAGTGAARRRRERRLRAWLRHERQSVAAAVAEALHHSAGPREKVVERRGRQEGEVHETHNALRSQTTPLPGKRPAPLSEVTGPQAAVTDGYVAAGVPLLGVPSLADSSAEAIDGSTLSFLLQRALEVKRKEEEEAVEAAELVELEEKLAAAEERLLAMLRRDREEGTRITPQTWSSLSRVEQFAVHWFVAKEKVGKKREKRKKKKRRRMWKTRRSLLRCSS